MPNPALPTWHTISVRFVGGHELHVATTDPVLRDVLYQSLNGSLGGRDTVTADALPNTHDAPLTDLFEHLHDVLLEATRDHLTDTDRIDDDECDCPACRAARTRPLVH